MASALAGPALAGGLDQVISGGRFRLQSFRLCSQADLVQCFPRHLGPGCLSAPVGWGFVAPCCLAGPASPAPAPGSL